MSDDKAQKLLQGGIKAARSGDKELARKAFLQVLKLEPTNEAAWLGMATVTDESKDKVRFLKKVLEINPANEKAQEALRRILGSASSGAMPTPNPFLASIDAPSPFDYATALDDDLPPPPIGMPVEEDLPLPPIPASPPSAPVRPSYLDELDMPPLPAAPASGFASESAMEAPSLDDLGLPPLPTTPIQASTAEPGTLRPLKSLRSQPEPEPQPEPEAALEDDFEPQRLTVDEAFARLPQPPAGEDGIPYIAPATAEEIGEEVLPEVQRLLEEALAAFAVPGTEWEKKKRGRAGEREYPIFVAQAAVGVLAFLIVAGLGLTSFILNNPAAQKLLFAPTFTPTFTPTVTPTNTPGATNTPSPTPSVSVTPSPQLLPTITPGNRDPNFPPEPTRVYYPVGIQGSPDIDRAIALLSRGRLDEALPLLEAEREVTLNSGDFVANYYLVSYYLLKDDPEAARELIASWEEDWAGTAIIDRYKVLTNVAKARVDLYEAEQIIAEQNVAAAEDLLTEAEELLTQVVGTNAPLDRNFADAHILLAQRHLLAEDQETALLTLNDAVTNFGYGSTELRLALARVLAATGNYDRSLQELAYILEIDPFLESALIAQVEIALQSGQAGLGVLFSQQYLLYYPGSVRGFFLLGQAREAENKVDLALNAYSRAALGDETDPAYLDVMIHRSHLYIEQKDFESASADLTRAMRLAGDNPEIRQQRMEAAFASGEYATVLEDAEVLLEERGINRAQVLLLKGQAEAELSEDFDAAFDSLNQALAAGRLTVPQRAVANEYLARVQLERGNEAAALEAIDSAIQQQETAYRRYLRANIRNEIASSSGSTDEFRRALADYEYILTWGQIFPYTFLEDAQESYDSILRRLGSR